MAECPAQRDPSSWRPSTHARTVHVSMPWNGPSGRYADGGRQCPGFASGCPTDRRKPAEDGPPEKDIYSGDPSRCFAVSVRGEHCRQHIDYRCNCEHNQVCRYHEIGVVAAESQDHDEDRERAKSAADEESEQIMHLPPPKMADNRTPVSAYLQSVFADTPGLQEASGGVVFFGDVRICNGLARRPCAGRLFSSCWRRSPSP